MIYYPRAYLKWITRTALNEKNTFVNVSSELTRLHFETEVKIDVFVNLKRTFRQETLIISFLFFVFKIEKQNG